MQAFFLSSRHLQQLKKEYGVQPWHFEQHVGEGVFIPAGCPHQVNRTFCLVYSICNDVPIGCQIGLPGLQFLQETTV